MVEEEEVVVYALVLMSPRLCSTQSWRETGSLESSYELPYVARSINWSSFFIFLCVTLIIPASGDKIALTFSLFFYSRESARNPHDHKQNFLVHKGSFHENAHILNY